MAEQQSEQQPVKKNKRQIPQTELDMHMLLTDPQYGDDTISPELREALKKINIKRDTHGQIIRDSEGRPIGTEESMWSLLDFYTRDMRLGNINKGNEMTYCQYHLDLAGDLLQEKCYESFIIALSRAVTILELSQSKEGFVRKRFSTLTNENMNTNQDVPKKSLFGRG